MRQTLSEPSPAPRTDLSRSADPSPNLPGWPCLNSVLQASSWLLLFVAEQASLLLTRGRREPFQRTSPFIRTQFVATNYTADLPRARPTGAFTLLPAWYCEGRGRDPTAAAASRDMPSASVAENTSSQPAHGSVRQSPTTPRIPLAGGRSNETAAAFSATAGSPCGTPRSATTSCGGRSGNGPVSSSPSVFAGAHTRGNRESVPGRQAAAKTPRERLDSAPINMALLSALDSH